MEFWSSMGNLMVSIVFIKSIAREYLPPELLDHIQAFIAKIARFVSSEISIIIEEYDGYKVSDVYESVERYLSSRSSSEAKGLKLKKGRKAKDFIFSMDRNEQIVDTYRGIKVWWKFCCQEPRTQMLPWFRRTSEEKQFYRMTFHRRDKSRVLDTYLPHVMEEAKELEIKTRQRKIYTNKGSDGNSFEDRNRLWKPMVFEHPATFDTLALDPRAKSEIVDDLRKFSKRKDYYKKVGRAWKRGYLLYGPPGTGKSSMIAAIANFLEYDIYDLELTQVKTNTELRKLLIATTDKSIIVIEDIDCSLDLSDRKKKPKNKKKQSEETKKPDDGEADEEKDDPESRVTLSGVLNFTDGLWSCCGNERLIIYTTNHKDRLDPALLRPGRMDKLIHLSYCRFGAFKVLACNYLGIESHPLFGDVEGLMDEAHITPADVCEQLMKNSDDPTSALQNLIKFLIDSKANQSSAAHGIEPPSSNLTAEEAPCPDGQPSDVVEESN